MYSTRQEALGEEVIISVGLFSQRERYGKIIRKNGPAKEGNYMHYLQKILTGEWVDPITRLPNSSFAEAVISELKNSEESYHVLKIRVNFSSTNPEVKTFAISRIAAVIKHSVRIPKDFVCRSGEQEFTIMLHGVSDNDVEKIGQRIKDSLQYLLLTYGNEKIKIDCEIDVEKLGGAR